jgi:hypothetical protein
VHPRTKHAANAKKPRNKSFLVLFFKKEQPFLLPTGQSVSTSPTSPTKTSRIARHPASSGAQINPPETSPGT